MKRPSFQFYVRDWQGNTKLKRCSPAEKGVWLDVMLLMHGSEEYGILRWSLKDIATAVGCKVATLVTLSHRGVLKGADIGQSYAGFSFAPKHAGATGDPVILIHPQNGPIWFSSRMVTDEHKRLNCGKTTRFGSLTDDSPRQRHGEQAESEKPSKDLVNSSNDAEQQKTVDKSASNSETKNHDSPRQRGGSRRGDGSSSSIFNTEDTNVSSGADAPPVDFKRILFNEGLRFLAQASGKPPDSLRSIVGKWCKEYGDQQTALAIMTAQQRAPVNPIPFINQTLKGAANAKPDHRDPASRASQDAARIIAKRNASLAENTSSRIPGGQKLLNGAFGPTLLDAEDLRGKSHGPGDEGRDLPRITGKV